ncbi:MAG: monooxygenase [Actinomycetes bacterium]
MTSPAPPADRAGGTVVPEIVTVNVWGVSSRRVPSALLRMAGGRFRLHSVAGLRFAKLLGTGSGRTFTRRDADLRHWALLACWETPADADAFAGGALHRSWDAIATELLALRLRPLSSRGRWSNREPFGTPAPVPWGGPVVALTRARIRPTQWGRFWTSVPPVSTDLRQAAGLRLAIGIGEAPVGLQGTLSVWDSAAAVAEFAYRRAAHREAIRRPAATGWYAEELFARFALLRATGTVHGQSVG